MSLYDGFEAIYDKIRSSYISRFIVVRIYFLTSKISMKMKVREALRIND
jgi:hypothetical protein